MPISHEFEYVKPKTIEELLEKLNNYGDRANILAGGTDLTVLIKEDVITPDFVIDIKGISGLNKIEFSDNVLMIGANVTFSDITESKIIRNKFRILWEAATTVGSVGVRNRATLVGNICCAVPSLDSAPALLVFDAVVNTKSLNNERNIPIEEWFISPKKTALKAGEFVTGISMKLPEEKNASCYKKLGRYSGEDLAQAGVGVLALSNKTYKIAFNAVGPIPTRAKKIEEFLKGKEITEEVFDHVRKLVEQEISPITDIRSTKEYRMHVAKFMLEKCLYIADALLKDNEIKSDPILH
ncbi:FAD binding domain-containing protein [Bacteroidota bacterium]